MTARRASLIVWALTPFIVGAAVASDLLRQGWPSNVAAGIVVALGVAVLVVVCTMELVTD